MENLGRLIVGFGLNLVKFYFVNSQKLKNRNFCLQPHRKIQLGTRFGATEKEEIF